MIPMNKSFYFKFDKELNITSGEVNRIALDNSTLGEFKDLLEPEMKNRTLLKANKQAITVKEQSSEDPITGEVTTITSTTYLKKIPVHGVKDDGTEIDGWINAAEWTRDTMTLRVFVRAEDYKPKGRETAENLDNGGDNATQF